MMNWKEFIVFNVCKIIPDKLFLQIKYILRFKRICNFKSPKTFNEKLQWLKLYNRKSEYTSMVDKYEAKKYIAEKVGAEYIIPTLGVWDKFEDVDFNKLPNKFVLKCTHDCGGLSICKDKNSFEIKKVRDKINHCLSKNYYWQSREWPYKNVKPKIIAEEYLESSSGELSDYKFLCFNGVPKIMYVATERDAQGEVKFDFYDMEFEHLPFTNEHQNSSKKIEKPLNFDKMKKIAQILSEGIPHLRVDFYDVNGKVYVGELTFFHMGGMSPFKPKEWDYKIGDMLDISNINKNEKLKIMLVTSTLVGGGAEREVSVWANELSKYGLDVTIMLAGRCVNEYLVGDGVKIVSVADTYEEYKQYSSIKKYILKRKLIKRNKPDYIISFLSQNRIWTFLCAWGLGIKRIETILSSPWHKTEENVIRHFIDKLSLKTCHRLRLQSPEQLAFYSKRIRKKSVIIPNIISDTYKTNYKTDFADEPECLIAVGRLCGEKNYFMMIDAFAKVCYSNKRYEQLKLKIYGGDDFGISSGIGYREKLQAYIKEKGLENNVVLVGFSLHIEKAFAENDIYLLSSDFEGLPNALMEAMASRLVCISTNCKTGPSDLIQDGINGYLVSKGSSEEMANAILKALSMDKDIRISMGNAAREKIMTYCSAENSISKLLECFM